MSAVCACARTPMACPLYVRAPVHPWRVRCMCVRPYTHGVLQQNQHTHLPKSTVADVAESLVVDAPTGSASLYSQSQHGQHSGSPQFPQHLQQNSIMVGMSDAAGATPLSVTTVIEFDDSLSNLWRQLRTL